MATFEVTIEQITIEPHTNADSLELAKIGGYKAVVGKGIHQSGDLVIYVPEQGEVPESLLKLWGFWDEEKDKGKLGGSKGNVVKPCRLRNELSQGIVIPLSVHPEHQFTQGQNVTELLGITKHEVPIPVHLQGEVWNASGMTLKYDIENIKKYNHVLHEGEVVWVSSKLHGTWCSFGFHPDSDIPIITSKGLSAQGIALKLNESNQYNTYVRMFDSLTINGQTVLDRIRASFEGDDSCNVPVYILGEIFGKSVQDLSYGLETQEFRVFDIYVGRPGSGRYLNYEELVAITNAAGVNMVPVLYVGPFSNEVVNEHTNAKETSFGKEPCLREGVVIKPVVDREEHMGRVVLKSISAAYLLRKNGTEFN